MCLLRNIWTRNENEIVKQSANFSANDCNSNWKLEETKQYILSKILFIGLKIIVL